MAKKRKRRGQRHTEALWQPLPRTQVPGFATVDEIAAGQGFSAEEAQEAVEALESIGFLVGFKFPGQPTLYRVVPEDLRQARNGA